MEHNKYYVEYDDEENVWAIVEDGGGNDHGQTYDVVICYITDKDDADYVKHLLNSK